MTDWSRGYPTAELYPTAWHSFQSPAHLRAVCALMGVAWDVDPGRPINIAEVGCGTGYTAAVLAAGTPGARVVGIDYNPAEIAEARSLAQADGLDNASFLELDLAELDDAALGRLPEFDVVTVHGVWSWVSDAVREGIVRLVRSRLRPGGVLLLSYNALPGAASGLSLSRIVRQSLQRHGFNDEGLDKAGELVRRLVDAEASHLPQSLWRSMVTGETKGLRNGYLLHEFSTQYWRPSFFEDVADALAGARCDFVGSATIDENFPELSLSPSQLALWDEARSTRERQLILDVCVHRGFRRDVYMKGVRPVVRDEAVGQLWLAAATHGLREPRLMTQAGEGGLPPDLIAAARAALADGPRQVAALRALPACAKATHAELFAFLVGSRCALPLWLPPQDGRITSGSLASSRRLNAEAKQRLARYGVGDGQFALASPALAGGLPVTALELAVGTICGDLATGEVVLPTVGAILQRLLPAAGQPEPTVVAELETVIGDLLRERAPVWRELRIL